MKRLTIRACAVLLAGTMALAGCNGPAGTPAKDELKALGKDEKATIKVMTNQDERFFYQTYGALFSAKYPNIDIEVASLQGVIKYDANTDINKEYEKFIDEKKPDVLLLMPDLYEKLAGSGRLYALDSVIAQDKFDLGGIMPAVLESIKSRSGGKLYGLAPGFSAQAIFYNKTMFESNGVPFPKDEMSWEELFELARRFPTTGDEKTRIYGFGANAYSADLFQYVRMIGETKGLRYADPDTAQVTIHTDAWKQAAQLALDTMKAGALYSPDPEKQFRGGMIEDYYKSDPFIGGKVAMMIGGNYMMDSLKQAKSYLKENTPEWDLVTVPVDPNSPGTAASLYVGQIFAVNAQSPNLRAAWEFVKYINDNEFARVTSKASTGMGEMTVRTAYLPNAEGRNVAAFSKLSGDASQANRSLAKLPPSFFQSFSGIAEQELKSALDGKQTVDDALKHIQEKGQEALLKAKQEEEAKGTP
ncbi:ABC transporter substrate-binding protein [Paenibacillus flagellatus]|uniref:ABC transporter substrate-binding protein n=1 Tax=Paenibacillus flagellatus TaxID=2211139 RepID=A0A2V5K9Y0_9BACL|nr:extracellular solute-binding protein [Paenibacillus flagellatus]PYI56349.1 hypothetical protein DLM86_05050 [Paenibacillus flagellatus]